MPFAAMDCFDWHPMDVAPNKTEYVFVRGKNRKGKEYVGIGKWERGKLTVCPGISIDCWPEAWAQMTDKADLNA